MIEYNLTGDKANIFGKNILNKGIYAIKRGKQIGPKLIMEYNLVGETIITWDKKDGETLINVKIMQKGKNTKKILEKITGVKLN